jgi:hypothetical protein
MFIFAPYHLLVKEVAPFLSYWKEGLFVLFLLTGGAFEMLTRKRFLYLYIFLGIIVCWDLFFQNQSDYISFVFLFEYTPVAYFAYFFVLNPVKSNSVFWLAFLMAVTIPYWVLVYERTGNYSYVFVPEEQGFSLLRNGVLRVRYCFDSPNSLAQFSWFISCFLCVYYFKKFKVYIIFLLVGLAVVAYMTGSRAAFLLIGASGAAYGVIRFSAFTKTSFRTLVFLMLFVFVVANVFFNVSDIFSRKASGQEKWDDVQRVERIQDGALKAEKNFVFGMGSAVFDPSALQFIDVENAWLPMIYSFGLAGITFLIYFVLQMITIPRQHKYYNVLIFSIPWLAYSFIYPLFQERNPLILTMFILGSIFAYKQQDLKSA